MMNLFIFSRKLHRLLVIVISFLTLVMGGTGILMKYPDTFYAYIDIGMVRALHNGMSLWFTIALLVMGATGLFMYFIPYLRTKKANEQNKTN